MRIYVASSWRNEARQQETVRVLREAGHEVYDFRNPAPGDNGFGWRQCATRLDYVELALAALDQAGLKVRDLARVIDALPPDEQADALAIGWVKTSLARGV